VSSTLSFPGRGWAWYSRAAVFKSDISAFRFYCWSTDRRGYACR